MYNEGAEAFEAGDIDQLMTVIMDIDYVYRRDHEDLTSRELQSHPHAAPPATGVVRGARWQSDLFF
jgi:hypothetical protein